MKLLLERGRYFSQTSQAYGLYPPLPHSILLAPIHNKETGTVLLDNLSWVTLAPPAQSYSKYHYVWFQGAHKTNTICLKTTKMTLLQAMIPVKHSYKYLKSPCLASCCPVTTLLINLNLAYHFAYYSINLDWITAKGAGCGSKGL